MYEQRQMESANQNSCRREAEDSERKQKENVMLVNLVKVTYINN